MSTSERRQEEKERRRTEIVDAAERVFAMKGLDRATMADVADEARLSRGLVYFYFKDKDDLYLALTVRAFERLREAFETAVVHQPDGLHKITAIGRAYVAFHREQPLYFQAMADIEARAVPMAPVEATENATACMREGECILQFMAAVITEGIADGSIRPDVGDPMLTGINLWGFTHGIIQLAANKADMLFELHQVHSEALIDQGFHMMLRALAPPTPG
ncbi:MAG: TetR/AcrR family transcriptional regulator [Rhodothermales bacterium]|nr:TetR/AcrR family transcriptional regulator [Rhodothermales bacterium]